MRFKVFKYEVPEFDCKLRLPSGAQLLSAGMKPTEEKLWVWARVPQPSHLDVIVRVRVIATGEPIDEQGSERWRFIDTVFQGPLVWHLFEVSRWTPK